MNRPVAQTHLSQLAELFTWMDQAPERRSLAPEARTPEGLWWEVLAGDEKAWVSLENGLVQGYASLVPFWDGAALEGPVIRDGDGEALLEFLVRRARLEGYPNLYAFPEASNQSGQKLLESLGFAAEHTTYFFEIGRSDLSYPIPKGFRIVHERHCDPQVYRDLYSRAEDGWSLRLSWNDEELQQHFNTEATELFIAYKNKEPVGLAELELDDTSAEIAYVGVVPEARGKGLGRALLGTAAHCAFHDPLIQTLRVRAHDHEKAAQELYKRLGFKPSEAVMTYALELQD